MNSQWHCISQQQSWKKGIEKYAKYWMKRTSKLSIKWEVEKEFSKRQSQKGNEGQIPIAMYDFSGIKNVRQQLIVPYLQIYCLMILMTHNKWLLVLFLHHDSNVRFLNKSLQGPYHVWHRLWDVRCMCRVCSLGTRTFLGAYPQHRFRTWPALWYRFHSHVNKKTQIPQGLPVIEAICQWKCPNMLDDLMPGSFFENTDKCPSVSCASLASMQLALGICSPTSL